MEEIADVGSQRLWRLDKQDVMLVGSCAIVMVEMIDYDGITLRR